MSAILEAIDLIKSYSGHRVLETGRLAFKEAEITAVCGQNGAGKSTLLRILALLEHPDQGRMLFEGADLSHHGDWFKSRKKVTMVDQNPYAFHGSVFHNTAFGLKVRGAPKAQISGRVEEALSCVGLSGLEGRRAGTLSGGELQRMAIARAIACEPEILILDEPTAHVDSERVREVEDLIHTLRTDKGMTVIIATHDVNQACRLADRVLRLENGRIEEDGQRSVTGRLKREDGALVICLDGPYAGADHAQLIALELAGEEVLMRLSQNAPQVRVPGNDIQQVKPQPGERIRITKSH